MSYLNYMIILCCYVNISYCIWPPPYKISLTNEEEFVIGEYDASNEDEKAYDIEDEMIKENDIRKFNIENDNYKYGRLHKQAKRSNAIKKDKSYGNYYKKITKEEIEGYFDLMEPMPWKAGFVDKNNKFINNNDKINVHHLNYEIKQSLADDIQKRETTNTSDYNYEELNNEYIVDVLKIKKSNDTFNSTNIEEEESVNEAVDKMVDFKSEPRNCTKEELRGIGFNAVKCIWIDIKKAESKETTVKLLKRLQRICTIWFIIYIVIAIPCWCQTGWCCCCFRCKFCKPKKRIEKVKKYLMDNPPGTFYIKKNQFITYKPTAYEEDAYNKLKNVLMNL